MSLTAAAARVAAKKAAKLAARKAREKSKEKGRGWWVLGAGLFCAFMSFQMIIGVLAGGIMSAGQSGMAALEEAQQCTTTGGSGNGADVVYASNGPVRLPVTGKYTVTSNFGMRVQPMLGVNRLHGGIDLATVPTGGQILAPKDGIVQSANPNVPGAGNFIVLDHGGGLVTRYLHLSEMHVKAGDKVKVGQKIGKEGNTTGGTGISTGAHLHFEVKKDGKPVDPRKWYKDNGVTVPAKGSSGTAGSAKSKGGSGSEGDTSKSSSKGSSKSPRNSAKNASKGSSNGLSAAPGNSAKNASSKSSSSSKGSSSGSSDFSLPKPDKNDFKHAGTVKPMPIPEDILKIYKEAGKKYGIPWPLLAGVGMEETHHGRNKNVSSAGAAGHMQFMPAAWLDHGIDGDGDGDADITNPADSIHSAANKLSSQGVKSGAEGVKSALRAYNQASWYGNDVLFYAHHYGEGNITVSSATASGGENCDPEGGSEGGGDTVEASSLSGSASDCKKSGSPGEKGLQPGALNGLRCGAAAAPWVETTLGVGERAGPSDHGSGNAVDFMIPKYETSKSNDRGWELAKWMKDNADKMDVKYVIFDQKIWNAERGGKWRDMEDRGSDTENHRDHVHVSFN